MANLSFHSGKSLVLASNQGRLDPALAFAPCELGLVYGNLRRGEGMSRRACNVPLTL